MSDLDLNRPERVYNPSSSHGISRSRKEPSKIEKLKRVIAVPAALRARTFSVTLQANVTQTITASDPKRRGFFLQNLSVNDVYVSFGTSIGPSFSDAILVPPNASFEFPANAAPTSDIYARSAATSAIVIIESTLIWER